MALVALRRGILDTLGLMEILKQEAAQFQERSGIVCHLKLPENPPKLSQLAATALFRIFQEALTNVAKSRQGACRTLRSGAGGD